MSIRVALTTVMLAAGLSPAGGAVARVRVGVYENRPLVFTAADGRPSGIYIDTLEHIAGKEGWSLDYVPGSWADCLERLERGEIDLLVAIPYSEARAARFEFNTQLVLSDWGQVYVREHWAIESVLDLQDKTVAVLEGGVYYEGLRGLLERFGVRCRFVEEADYAAVLDAVVEGRADAGVTNRLYGAQIAPERALRRTPIVFSPVELRFAAPRGTNAALLAALDSHLSELKLDKGSAYHQSLDRWLGRVPEAGWPRWLPWVLGAAAGLLALFLVGNAVLGAMVRARTAEQRARNVELHEEIAERHRAEQERAESEREKGLILGSISELVSFQDTEMRILWANRAAGETVGLLPEELTGRPCYSVWCQREAPADDCPVRRAMETGEAEHGEMTSPDGRVWDIRGYPARGADGEIMGAVEVTLEITDRRRAEEEARREARFRHTLVEASPAFFVAIDADDKTLMMNESMLAALGYTLEEVVGKDYLTTFVPARDRERLGRVFHRLTDLKAPALNENHVVAKDGRELLVEWHGRPVLDEDDELEYFFGVGVDITERRRAEQELREREARYRAIVEDQTELICRYRPGGTLTFVNEAYCRYFGKRPEELEGRRFFPLIPEADREAVRQRLAAISPEHPVVSQDHRVLVPDGGVRWLHWINRGIVDDQGQIAEIQAVGRDITERVRAEAELRAHRERLEELVAERTVELRAVNAELEAFAYSVSHDLRAPLRAMEGFSAALLDDYGDRLDDEGRDYAGSIVDAARRMDVLIRDLLAYSRVGRAEMRLAPTSLDHVLEETLMQLAAEVQDSRAGIHIDSPLPAVVAHHVTLVQAVTNLVSNALKFVAPGERPRVRVWAEPQAGTVRLWVEDQGIGIDSEHLERIFTVFERLHGADAYAGTGVGLAIVRRGIERMGGRVGMESEPGKGSRFWIELPEAASPTQAEEQA